MIKSTLNYCCFLLLICISVLLRGQDTVVPPAVVADGTAVEQADVKSDSKLLLYLEKKKLLNEIDGQINLRLTQASLGTTRQYQATMNKIKELRDEKKIVAREILETAVDAFLEAPNQQKQVEDDCIRYLRSLLGEQSTDGWFSPDKALTVAKRLIAGGIKNNHAYVYGAQAAYAVEEFEQAKTFLSSIAIDGATVDPATTKRIDEAVEKWNRELRFRESDAKSVLPRVVFKTELGDFTVELYENEAPNTVNNFIWLVEQKFYNGLFFFYCQPGQISMAGCKRGDGSTNAGYFIPDELTVPELRHHFRGSLSMGNIIPNEGSSVFGILHQPMSQRDGKSAVFGRVVEGMDVIYKVPVISPNTIVTGGIPVKIHSATVVRKQSHPYEPQMKLPLGGEPEIIK